MRRTRTPGPRGVCWGQTACVPQSSYVEIVVVVFRRWGLWGHEGGAPRMGSVPGEGPQSVPDPASHVRLQ